MTVLKIAASFLAGAALCTCLYFLLGMGDDVAYVDNQKLFNEYKLTSIYKREMDLAKKDLIRPVDSLKRLRIVISRLPESPTTIARRMAIDKELEVATYAFEMQMEDLTAEYDAKIWNSINAKLMEFGKSCRYDLILGANGTGTLLYAHEKKDITAEAIEYLNK